MITLFNTKEDKTKSISILNNPFNKECIEAVNIFIYKRMLPPHEIVHDATIKFKNGNTNGEQRIRATDLPNLLLEIQNFIDSLS